MVCLLLLIGLEGIFGFVQQKLLACANYAPARQSLRQLLVAHVANTGGCNGASTVSFD
jgi:hypothetical protein